MMITPFIKEAMERLIILDRGSVEWIWIDQICTDQLNGQERAGRVNIMKDIYQKSEGTIIWLGPDILGIEATTSWMEKMWHLQNKYLDYNRGRTCRPYTIERFRATAPPPAEDPFWKILGELLSRPWFVRTWVIQEAVLSKATPRLLCGSQELPWEKLLGSAT
jgi:Heterokaryon incompatibility protein (HET)